MCARGLADSDLSETDFLGVGEAGTNSSLPWSPSPVRQETDDSHDSESDLSNVHEVDLEASGESGPALRMQEGRSCRRWHRAVRALSLQGSHTGNLTNASTVTAARKLIFQSFQLSDPWFQDDEEIQEIPNPPQLPSVAEDCWPRVRL